MEVVPNKGVLGQQFRKDSKPLMDWLNQLDSAEAEKLELQLKTDGSVR